MKHFLQLPILACALALITTPAAAGTLTGTLNNTVPSSDPSHIYYSTVDGYSSTGVYGFEAGVGTDSGAISIQWEANLTYSPVDANDLPPSIVTITYKLHNYADAYVSLRGAGDQTGSGSAKGEVRNALANTGTIHEGSQFTESYFTAGPTQENRTFITSVSSWTKVGGVWKATKFLDLVSLTATATLNPQDGIPRDDDMSSSDATQSASTITVS